MTGDGDQFSAQLLTENPCLGVTFDAGQRTAAHRAVYMDVAIGKKFRPRTDRRDHDQIATLGIYLLATTYWRGDYAGRFDARLRRLFRLLLTSASGVSSGRSRAPEGGSTGMSMAMAAAMSSMRLARMARVRRPC